MTATDSRAGAAGSAARRRASAPPACALGLWLALAVACCAPGFADATEAAGSAPATIRAPVPPPLPALIRQIAHPIRNTAADYDRLLAAIGDARFVLLGEDTHGTREFYQARATLTRRLVAERGFSAVVIEADEPDAASLAGFLAGSGNAGDAATALDVFQRFPRWMWRNTDFRDFIGGLRDDNLRALPRRPVLVHGMDLYQIRQSIAAVVAALETYDPAMAADARNRYACFERAAFDAQIYGARMAEKPPTDCAAVAQAVVDLVLSVTARASPGPPLTGDAAFHALQAARAVRNAEEYFRILNTQPAEAWNYRDRHMAETVEALLAHLDAAATTPARIVIWAHNAHVGDARATSRGDAGYLSVGQLLRERHGAETFLVGFTTARGSIRAATDWDGPDMIRRLRRPISGSHAAILHATGLPRFYLLPRESPRVRRFLDRPRPQRGVGVRYLPALEMAGHYYRSRLSSQYDAVVHFDRSTPLIPLGH